MEAETPRSNGYMMRFITHPITASLTFALTVFAAVVTIYSFTMDGSHRDLMYFVHPVKTAVVRTAHSSRISVQIDNEPVNQDVTAAQIAIWNNGKESIRHANLLGSSRLFIRTGPENPIIDARVLEVSRDEVVKLELDQSEIGAGELGVEWDILEYRDGAILQLTYFGDSQTLVTASATVEQQGGIRAQYQRRQKETLFVGGFFIVLGLALGVLAYRDFSRKRKFVSSLDGADLFIMVVPIVTTIFALGTGSYLLFWQGLSRPITPFDFF